jgi:hypothetical protein
MSEPDPRSAELRATLARLHAELSQRPAVDAESRRLLAEVSADIERVIASPGGPAPRVEALAARFEAGHPDLAASLRQLIDLLGRAGI